MAWARTSIHVQEYGTRHQHDFHLTPYFLESVLEQSLQPCHFSNFSHRAAGKVGGTLTKADRLNHWLQKGARFIYYHSDPILRQGISAFQAQLR